MRYKEIFESVISLSVLNIVNIVLPLITLPYLIRTLGLSNYGAYSIVYALLQYVLLFSQYGFNYTATQQIAQNINNKEYINTIFTNTIAARLFIAVVVGFIFSLVVISYESYSYIIMYLWGIGMVVGDCINPVWVFQGFEKMRYMTVVNVICKVLFTILTFLFIIEKDDYIYVPLLNSLGFILSGLLSLYIAISRFKIKLIIPTFNEIIIQFKSAFYIFISSFFMNMYRNLNVFLLSYFVPETGIGMYAGAEKMIKAAQSIASPVSNAFYPHFAKKSSGDVLEKLFKLSKFMGIILGIITLVCVLSASFINELFLDPNEKDTILLMQVMAPIIFVGGLNYVWGIVGLVNVREHKFFTLSVFISGIVSVTFLLSTVNYFGIFSGAIAMNISECVLGVCCVYRLLQLRRKN